MTHKPQMNSVCRNESNIDRPGNIVTSQRNMMFPETVEALSIVLDGYKNKLIQ